MKALIERYLAIQILFLTASVFIGTTACWFSICELTHSRNKMLEHLARSGGVKVILVEAVAPAK